MNCAYCDLRWAVSVKYIVDSKDLICAKVLRPEGAFEAQQGNKWGWNGGSEGERRS